MQTLLFVKKHLGKAYYPLSGMLFTAIAGSLLHFVFGWSKSHPLAALISPVNESVWEHLKLLFFPVLAFTAWERQHRKPEAIFLLPSRLLGLLAGLAFIPTSFYAYTHLLGTNWLWADLTIFFLSVILTYLLSFFLENRFLSAARSVHAAPRPAPDTLRRATVLQAALSYIPTVLFLCLALLFFLFTFIPPRLPLFQDPASGAYGYFRS